jgi:hypothetical protein
VKINIHSDQYIYPANNKPARPVSSPAPGILSDALSATQSGSNIKSALDNLSGTRAARVAHLRALYTSGSIDVNSALVAQAIVSGGIA